MTASMMLEAEKKVFTKSGNHIGGFQLLDLIITELKSHIPVKNSRSLIGGNFICQKKSFTRFALQSECCNFNQ